MRPLCFDGLIPDKKREAVPECEAISAMVSEG
jgi:hypothetical protein